MDSRRIYRVVAIVGVTVLIEVAGIGKASVASREGCSVEFTSPRAGDQVGARRAFGGRATVPPDGYLWVFAHVAGLSGWWPQGGGPADVFGGEWEVLVFFGGPKDVGLDFEVAVAVVDEATNRRLNGYFEEANRIGSYEPMRFPDTLSGCVPKRLRLTKTSHR